MGKPYFYPRKFDGKTFKYDSAFASKTEAKKRAKELREKGFHARVAPDKDWGGRGYNVYKRKK